MGRPRIAGSSGHQTSQGDKVMKPPRTAMLVTAAICVLSAVSVFATGPTFRADYRFTGSSLSAFKPLGQADWKVQNGEIVGTPKDPAGGWLLLDGKMFQDTKVSAI